MMGLAQTMLGMGSMAFPLVVEQLMNRYGYRGCMAIIAALNGHALVGMMTMHPIEWHKKTIEIDEDEEKLQNEIGAPQKSEELVTNCLLLNKDLKSMADLKPPPVKNNFYRNFQRLDSVRFQESI